MTLFLGVILGVILCLVAAGLLVVAFDRGWLKPPWSGF